MITRDNLKIFKPEKLGNFDEAGGQRTRHAIDSGKLNELFSAISDIDHAQSAVDIAKCYPGLDTPGTDNLLDAHVFIGQPPSDPLVSTFLVESPLLDDADRLPDMKEIIESSLVAGSLQKKGMPGFLPYQNTFNRSYLYSTYEYNGRQYTKSISLSLGQVIVIAVEYEGNEDLDWPRRQHFAQVTNVDNENDEVEFSPALDFATPASNININGDNYCTVLRFVSEVDALKYHGVAQLNAIASGTQLSVSQTQASLLPEIIIEQVRAGLSLGDTGSHDLIRKTVSQVATASQSYHFMETDVLVLSTIYADADFNIGVNYYVGGVLKTIANSSIYDESIYVVLGQTPDLGTQVTISYLSDLQYQFYNNQEVLPSNSQIIRGTLAGSMSKNSARTSITEADEGIYIYSRLGAILDYDTGVITYSSDEYLNLVFDCLITVSSEDNSTEIHFILAVVAPKLSRFYVQVQTVSGGLLSGSGDEFGQVTGTGITGFIQGVYVELNFSEAVVLSSLRYDITEYLTQLPPPELYGLDPLRIPNGGRVNIFHKWNPIAISDKQEQALNSVVQGQVLAVRAGADFVDMTDTEGRSLWTADDSHYVYDNALSRVTINSDCSEFVFPLILADTLSELALVIDKTHTSITVAKALSRDYPVGAVVSSVQVLGDLQARVTAVRDMTAWVNDWEEDGASANANLNVVDYPIEVTNDTATNEEWVLIFTSDSSFRVLGRRLGQIATSDTLSDLAPINPLTTQPFFVIRQAAFGSGWNAGEAIRFGTLAAAKPVMPVRTVQVGHSQQSLDQTVLAFRGNEG